MTGYLGEAQLLFIDHRANEADSVLHHGVLVRVDCRRGPQTGFATTLGDEVSDNLRNRHTSYQPLPGSVDRRDAFADGAPRLLTGLLNSLDRLQ